jgi:hypothetical protein
VQIVRSEVITNRSKQRKAEEELEKHHTVDNNLSMGMKVPHSLAHSHTHSHTHSHMHFYTHTQIYTVTYTYTYTHDNNMCMHACRWPPWQWAEW